MHFPIYLEIIRIPIYIISCDVIHLTLKYIRIHTCIEKGGTKRFRMALALYFDRVNSKSIVFSKTSFLTEPTDLEKTVTYVIIWYRMESYGTIWFTVESIGFAWKSIVSCRIVWFCMQSNGFGWISYGVV